MEYPRYDKLSWYEDPDVLALKKKQLEPLTQWLLDHNLVQDFCRDYYTPPLADDFALDGCDLTSKGQKILDKCFKAWVDRFDADLSVFEQALNQAVDGRN